MYIIEFDIKIIILGKIFSFCRKLCTLSVGRLVGYEFDGSASRIVCIYRFCVNVNENTITVLVSCTKNNVRSLGISELDLDVNLT